MLKSLQEMYQNLKNINLWFCLALIFSLIETRKRRAGFGTDETNKCVEIETGINKRSVEKNQHRQSNLNLDKYH
ncbi:hypothetical protein CWB98_03290 [Pseudoalteromonas rubra]|uniref:Uncharacterized protein n=1 Tax=Pseudoalteromonas rubra TaxID=43658 RepID=A0A5S3X6P9_9GAMM|nr:hypothetical protein CWB98_03290 [Pseudoalteromonas rubra]